MPDLSQTSSSPSRDSGIKPPSRFFTEYYGSAFLLLIAFFVFVAAFFLKPIIDDIKQTNAMTQSELQIAQSERVYLDGLDHSITAAQTISSDVLERVNQALPDSANTPALLVQFGSAAYANGVKIESIGFTEAKPAKPTAAVPASLTVPVDIALSVHAKSYFDIKRFLASLETSLRIVDVVSMSSSGGQGDLYYNLQLRTYVFQAPVKAPVIH